MVLLPLDFARPAEASSESGSPVRPSAYVYAGGGSRTLMILRSRDFESRVSAIPPLRRRHRRAGLPVPPHRLECLTYGLD